MWHKKACLEFDLIEELIGKMSGVALELKRNWFKKIINTELEMIRLTDADAESIWNILDDHNERTN